MYFIFGISHKSASIEVREKYSTTSSLLDEYYSRLSFIDEVVILSTCNRLEIYGYLKGLSTNKIDNLRYNLFRIFNVPINDMKNFYLLVENNCIQHLFEVTTGIDSKILGETQIYDQVKKSYYKSLSMRKTGYFLNKLFQRALFVAGKVRNKVCLNEGKISLASVVKQLILEHLKTPKILIIGTGDIVLNIIPYINQISKEIYISSTKHHDKATEISKKFNTKVLKFENIKNSLTNFDIVITATNYPFPIISDEDLNNVKNKLLIIDLAVPRNVKTRATKNNLIIYNIDDILRDIDKNSHSRINKMYLAKDIIWQEVNKFMYNLKCDLMKRNIVIGSRSSTLAKRQVEEFLEKLKLKVPSLRVNFTTKYFNTSGDIDKNTPIYKIEGTDFFTDFIEEALIKGEIDIAVHSAKDLPDVHKDEIITIALTTSEDKTDCLVLREDLRGYNIYTLPSGSIIGVSSKRRIDQITYIRPDLITKDIRGNIEERLEKLDRGKYDGIIMATIALKRLNLENRISQIISTNIFDTHPLQGSLAIQIRKEDIKKFSFFMKIDSRKKIAFDTKNIDLEKKLVDFVNKYLWQNFIAFSRDFLKTPDKVIKVDIDNTQELDVVKTRDYILNVIG
ncbi:MAG: glutamyl-tRNA reductase [Brevinematales bacterium]|nr:glutamyl-tRNA reductase [Brevinematales bacterium]